VSSDEVLPLKAGPVPDRFGPLRAIEIAQALSAFVY
jgi:hypothetical protein